MIVLTEAQIDVWREREAQRQQDAANIEYNRARDEHRLVARQEMLDFLGSFLNDLINLQQFKDTFDLKTRKEWNVFGLKGPSGAMFLNTLVKHLPDQQATAEQLRRVLPAPQNAAEARARLNSFYDYLMKLVQQGVVTKRQVQPMRAVFFVSGWLSLQSPALWPPHYISGQRALSADDLYTNSEDPIADYFAFRDVFLALMSGLSLSAWELEHLLVWFDDRPSPTLISPALEPSVVIVGEPAETEVETEIDTIPESTTWAESTAHTRVQWQLASLGRALNCDVWIASNDHNRAHDGQRLGDLSEAALPTMGMDFDTRKIVGLIDLIWLQGKKVVAAFEIESTTSIHSGLLRMSDLVAVAPNINFPLYLVVPADRVPAVRKQLCRETFQVLELPDRCRYLTFESLQENYEPIVAWANSPDAIRKLSHKVDCDG